MLCYRDMTFCKFYLSCANGSACRRAYTPAVAQAARDWWGNDNAPVAFYAEHPQCWEVKQIETA